MPNRWRSPWRHPGRIRQTLPSEAPADLRRRGLRVRLDGEGDPVEGCWTQPPLQHLPHLVPGRRWLGAARLGDQRVQVQRLFLLAPVALDVEERGVRGEPTAFEGLEGLP